MASLQNHIKSLLPKTLPPVLKPRTGNLYDVLSRTPSGGVGSQVHQARWGQKGINDSYWVVSRAKFKAEGRHGKAWGKLYWKGAYRRCANVSELTTVGVPVSEKEERISGALKYSWKEGKSKAVALSTPANS